MSFDFPFKKGSGIPLQTANLSPQCLSLLHAMVAYDPDERITAHQALQHPYFQEQRWVVWMTGGGQVLAAEPGVGDAVGRPMGSLVALPVLFWNISQKGLLAAPWQGRGGLC